MSEDYSPVRTSNGRSDAPSSDPSGNGGGQGASAHCATVKEA